MANSENPIMCAMGWLRTAIKTVPKVISDANGYCEIFPHAVNAPYPAVGLSEVLSDDRYTVLDSENEDIVMTYCDISVLVVTKSANPRSGAPIYRNIHQCIHKMFDTPLGDMGELGKVVSCYRVKPVYYPERDKEDNVWQYIGGIYRIGVQ